MREAAVGMRRILPLTYQHCPLPCRLVTTRRPVAWCMATLEKHRIRRRCVALFDAWLAKHHIYIEQIFTQELRVLHFGRQTTRLQGDSDTRDCRTTGVPMGGSAAVPTSDMQAVSLEETTGEQRLLVGFLEPADAFCAPYARYCCPRWVGWARWFFCHPHSSSALVSSQLEITRASAWCVATVEQHQIP